MKQYLITGSALSLAFFALGLSLLRAGEESRAALKAQAQVAQARAEKIALSKVPDGRITSVEIEKENGRLVWSFDIAVPHSENVTEVQIDAKTSKIVLVKIETPEQQMQEIKDDHEGNK